MPKQQEQESNIEANSKSNTHFGFSEVLLEEKANLVKAVFDKVAPKYDLMNDIMSFGLHRLWKLISCSYANVKSGDCILDLAGGTGDLAKRLSKKIGRTGTIILADINFSMLTEGRNKLINAGIAEPIKYVQADAEKLPFPNNNFHCITMAFGLRNVTNQVLALGELARTLRPGGSCFILEFSHPILPGLKSIYDFYSFNLIPKIGQIVTGSAAEYQYLVESIRRHPDQETLKNMMLDNGFDKVEIINFAGGIVALHKGIKY